MSFCCICGLEYTSGTQKISFHRLPKKMEKKSRWLANCFVLTGSGKLYLKPDSVPTIFNIPLRAKYNINLVDQHMQIMQQPNTCDDIANTTRKSSIKYLHEEPSSNELIAGTSTQNTNIMNNVPEVYTLIQRKRITKLGVVKDKIESENVEVMDCDEDRSKLQRTLEKVTKFKKKVKMYQQKCRRLEKKVVSLTLLMKHLQDQKLLSDDAAELLENTVSETERQIIKRHLKGKKRGAFPNDKKVVFICGRKT
ncbi:unnamed protein product [Lasius platythorax]|uniref:THAP-type domain-containing protein n=1 Tax=Lasius platythorax TaxID=488582 RepID=A0AAV2NNB5_9HYME